MAEQESKGKLQLGGKGKKKKVSHGRLPTKRYINLAVIGEKKVNYMKLLPAVIIGLVLVVVFAKFAVIDPLNEASAEEEKVSVLQHNVTIANAKIDSFGELIEKYAHYTYSGMTEEELNRADRLAAMEMIDRVVIPKAIVGSWQISGNVLSMSVACETLEEVNLLAQEIRKEPTVEFVNVTTAQSDENPKQEDDLLVIARMNIYLTNPPEEEEEADAG